MMTQPRTFRYLLFFLAIAIVWHVQAEARVAFPPSTLDWKGWVTVAVFAVVLVCLIRELYPPAITLFGGACFLTIIRVVSPKQLMSGFAQPILLAFAMLFIVATALESAGILGFLARRAMPKSRYYPLQLISLLPPLSLASAFFNNTPLVLMMTPVVRRWANGRELSPSLYLIPLSFATILGGMCTLIGTSTNLVVSGMLHRMNGTIELSFFEFGYVGLPIAVIGLIYLILFGRRLLPERSDPAHRARQETKQYTAEFEVLEESPLAGKTIQQAGQRFFPQEFLIEIRRGERVYDSPAPHWILRAGDCLVFACDVDHIANLMAIKGLKSLADPKFELDVEATHFAEAVVAINSFLVGKSLRRTNFRSTYGASVVAVYRQGRRVTGPVGDVVLLPGDTMLLLSNRPWELSPNRAGDLYPITSSRQVPLFVPRRATITLIIFFAMVVAMISGVSIVMATLSAGALVIVTRQVTFRRASSGIDWQLLLLIASATVIGGALRSTGVANMFAHAVLAVVGTQPNLLVGGVLLVTMLVTELITNTAAALIMFPIVLNVIQIAGHSSVAAVKAAAISVAIGASSSFLTPIGYQTNTIVYGPGGYRFADYMRVGFPLSILVLLVGSILIPYFWKFS